MPPKRKALATADANKEVAPPPAKRAARGAASASVSSKKGKEKETVKAAGKATSTTKNSKKPQGKMGTKKVEISAPKTVPNAAEAPNGPKPNKFKYSNAETLTKSPAPEFVNMAWPQGEEDDDEDEEIQEPGDPKVGDTLTEEMIRSVSSMGYPISEDGMAKFEWMVDEQDKRDQDLHGMCIYNDFSGYGIGEVIQNLLADFNKILFKKDVSPFKKWAFVEALATFFKLSFADYWMRIDDSEGLKECINMIGTMVLTTIHMLSEHDLLGNSASSPLPNVSIMMLLILEFVKEFGQDLDIMWAHEVVRQLDKAGLELKLRKEVAISQEHIDELRGRYMKNEEENLYETHAQVKNWEPDDDTEPDEFGDSMERKWARWDWKKEFAEFKVNHPAGNHYNLELWSKRDKAPYTFGTKEFEKRMKF